ncbi:hypothetical protein [Fischerella thermalis]|uniref:hypothetical protein n=1 Tax=Fischerella thermalis TaxID=372787 RepID=UPI002155206C|nr:hypothetical protein [Fischerella thermalis]
MRLPKGRIRMVNRYLHFRSSCGTLGYTEGDRNLHLHRDFIENRRRCKVLKAILSRHSPILATNHNLSSEFDSDRTTHQHTT